MDARGRPQRPAAHWPSRRLLGRAHRAHRPATSAIGILYTAAGKNRLKGPNDLVFDAAGGFYFTGLGKVCERDQDRGAVYYAKADGSMIREVIFPLFTPNGIGRSPDGRVLYVAETETARLWAFDLAGRYHRGLPGRGEPASHCDAGTLGHQHLLWRTRPADGVHHAVLDGKLVSMPWDKAGLKLSYLDAPCA
jgi:sugar lactone lactonase YvrE